MRRRRISLLLLIPGLISGFLIVLWSVSYFACVHITRAGVRRDAAVLVARGNIIFWHTGGAQAEPPFDGRSLKHGEWMVQVARVPKPPEPWMVHPVSGFPLWLALLPTVIGPVVWLDRRWAARKALRQGMCPVCGYDLRATPDGKGMLLKRCPECGNETAAKADKIGLLFNGSNNTRYSPVRGPIR